MLVTAPAGSRGAACGLHSAAAAGKFTTPRGSYGAGAAVLMVAGAAMLGEWYTVRVERSEQQHQQAGDQRSLLRDCALMHSGAFEG